MLFKLFKEIWSWVKWLFETLYGYVLDDIREFKVLFDFLTTPFPLLKCYQEPILMIIGFTILVFILFKLLKKYGVLRDIYLKFTSITSKVLKITNAINFKMNAFFSFIKNKL